MLSLRARDPMVRLDAARQTVEFLADAGDVARFPLGDLHVGPCTQLIERALDCGTDALNLFQVILAACALGFRLRDVQTQLIRRCLGPHEHRASVIPSAKGGADFSEPFPKAGDFLFLVTHDLGLAGELRLQRVEFGHAAFQLGDVNVPFFDEPRQVGQIGEAAVTSRQLFFQAVHDFPVLCVLLAQLDLKPVHPTLRGLQLDNSLAEPIDLVEPALQAGQSLLEIDTFVFFRREILLRFRPRGIGLTNFIGVCRQCGFLIAESLELPFQLAP